MRGGLVLRSPGECGVHLVLGVAPGAHETLARLVRVPAAEGVAGAPEVVESSLLPPGLRAAAWCGGSGTRLAACSALSLHLVDLSRRDHPHRLARELPTGACRDRQLGAGLVWVRGAADRVAVACGASVLVVDPETGARCWEHAPQLADPLVTSLAAVDEHTLLAGWGAPAAKVCLLDVRAPASAGLVLAQDVAFVCGLCSCPLDPRLAASHTPPPAVSCAPRSQSGTCQIAIWDVRLGRQVPEPVGRLHDASRELGAAFEGLASLEWSPSKSHTLLAVDAAGGASVCRLWSRGQAEETSSCWLGEARALGRAAASAGSRAAPAAEQGASADVVAAGWAHEARPGLALGVRRCGALAALEQRTSRLCAWSPRGGAAVLQQWGAPGSAALDGRAGEASVPSRGAPAWLQADDRMAAGDATRLMRSRVADFSYGAGGLSYDEYSRVARATGGGAASSQALAAMWQWVKGVDAQTGSPAAKGPDREVGAGQRARQPDCWDGAQAAEVAEDDMEAVREPFRGVRAYESEARRRALQGLGFPKVEAAPACVTQPGCDDAVRRVLSAVLWLQFDRAATDVEALASFSGPSARARLPQLALVFHAAACLLSAAAGGGGGRRARADSASGEDALRHARGNFGDPDSSAWPPPPPAGAPLPAHALRGALSGLLDPGGLQGLPAAATLRLALRVAEAVVGAAADEADAFEDDRPPTLEQQLRSLLCPAPAGAGRVDVGFRCAVALRFLPQAALKAVLGAAKEECKDGGLLDGLCIFGLGGAEGDTPLTTACAEDLAADPCSSATFSPLPRAEGGHSVPGITSNKSWPSMSCEQSSAEHAGDEGARLVQGFVERTGDIQSAALLFCHAAHLERPPAALRRYAAQYASLLARWQMYEQRADLLTLLISRLPTEDAPCNRGLVVFCQYCNGALTGPLRPPGAGDADVITQRCLNMNCGKPTPSCALCLLPIYVARSRGEELEGAAPSAKLPFDSWAAWCQVCHHGGHIGHLEEWFAKHTECPVAGCDCQCGLLL